MNIQKCSVNTALHTKQTMDEMVRAIKGLNDGKKTVETGSQQKDGNTGSQFVQ